MIKEKLDEYLLFNPGPRSGITVSRLTRIFGGAIRDVIAEQPIHDIDILCGSRSYNSLKSVLEENGYTYMDDLIAYFMVGISTFDKKFNIERYA